MHCAARSLKSQIVNLNSPVTQSGKNVLFRDVFGTADKGGFHGFLIGVNLRSSAVPFLGRGFDALCFELFP
jgi:hypothetical protein